MTTTEHSHVTRTAPIEVETLIVGFGFSVIPLLRELEARGQEHTILSDGQPIWQQLAEKDRLNFDLVSSFHASYYSYDQVEAQVVANYYPTAREFFEYHERLFAQFRHKVIEDRVELAENHSSYSLVRTARGRVYKARNLVFATGLTRPQNETIKQLKLEDVHNQTIVFNTIGDTANMMIARAVPQRNRVILLNNGFVTLDKYMGFDIPGPKGSHWYIPMFGVRTGKHYALDLAQGECQTVERLWPQFYKDLISIPLGPPDPESFIAKWVLPHVFHVRFPETYRRNAARGNRETAAGVSNGLVGIKYWPIDMYEHRFGEELEQHIKSGVLVNDIIFFHTQGLVETWSKAGTSVDLENKTISRGGEIVPFDLFIDGGKEEPRLPPIVFVGDEGLRHAFRYDYRDNYLGVVPSKLRNVYFIGYTRPFSGGLANMTEMQGLMVHKLISEPKRAEQLYADIHERLAKYNAHYYPKRQERSPTDHLVFYGSYTNDVAHFIGIERKLSSCLSWNPRRTLRSLQFELLHPNNALKYRMDGEYKVEGAAELCRKVSAHNENWAIMKFVFLSALWDKLLGYLCLLLLFFRYGMAPFVDLQEKTVDFRMAPTLVAWGAVCIGAGILFKRNLHIVNLLTYSLAVPLVGLKASLQPLAMIYIAYTGNWSLGLAFFALWSAIAFLFRQFHAPPISGRYLFADCKYKHKYHPFWERYQAIYDRVHARPDAAMPAAARKAS